MTSLGEAASVSIRPWGRQLVAAGPGTRDMPACPDRRAIAGDLGIGELLCLGGDCKIYARVGDRLVHQFATEPRLQAIDLAGPSAGLVKEGDVLVAVDGLLVTTAEGGDRLGARSLESSWPPERQQPYRVRNRSTVHVVASPCRVASAYRHEVATAAA